MNELTISKHNIKERIFNFRNSQVMLDRDLAELYHVETKVLNHAVKRNIKRFPNAFRFQLSEQEKTELVTNCDRFSALKHSSSLPYVFTEQGVSMLSAILKSDIAIEISIMIIEAFVAMRKHIASNNLMYEIEKRLSLHDESFNTLFRALQTHQRDLYRIGIGMMLLNIWCVGKHTLQTYQQINDMFSAISVGCVCQRTYEPQISNQAYKDFPC